MRLGKYLTEMTKPKLEELKEFLNLTDSEKEVFELLRRGKGIVQISMACGVSESTVSNRIRAIKNKMPSNEDFSRADANTHD